MRPRLPSLRSSLLRFHGDILKIQEVVDLVPIEPQLTPLERAVVALEDRRFFAHQGYDWKSIAREIVKAISLQRFGGASTIDIQLFRTVSNRYERTVRRKLREILGARVLQRKFSKIEILRSYLAIAYFGTELTGSEAASLAMFEKPCVDLDENEALTIASMLVYPKPRIATVNWHAKVRRRAEYGRLLLGARKQNSNEIRG